ncbi:acyl-CoA dehydrogenase family protein [Streptomyces sp. MST-110588]|uniref:acyl-CoA dehydrogenase family protein n=1 Tax=Streptomyces sp. MST-110588 TaxID=2833628 RepID=UPI001F5DCBFF|nr:acyl-CoA dehydrogenase family protein [Streptomyces sp. MST-110588]UNO41423.1 acyl-CoA/acyl-ACP dehydrogenase [Streptomyces sp. MST-110588]
MDAAFTEEQHEIRRTLRELLHKRCGPDEVKAAVRTSLGYDESLWRLLARRLGLPGLALPAVYTGVGCGPAELALACEETGRTLLPSPLLPTAVLAAPLILRLGTGAQRASLLPRLAGGELTGTLVVPGGRLTRALALTGDGDGDGAGGDWPGGDWSGGGRAGGIQARYVPDQDQGRNLGQGQGQGENPERSADWRLYGEAGQVLDGHGAGLLVVAAHTGGYTHGRTLLFLVRGDAPGLVRTRQTAMDETRPLGRLELRHVPAELLGGASLGEETSSGRPGRTVDGRTGDAVARALAWTGAGAAAALACEAVGAADAALTRTVAHVKVRQQFGRPIGSFQAVRHRLADLYVKVRAARSAAYYAAWAAAVDGGTGTATDSGTGTVTDGGTGMVTDGGTDPERGVATTDGPGRGPEGVVAGGLALAQALEALCTVAAETIQLHGGIGFTWEHDAHLYFKRAACDELLFGPVHRLRARAAEAAGLFVADGGREAVLA